MTTSPPLPPPVPDGRPTLATPMGAPGRVLGLVGLVLAIVVPVAGIVVSAIARVQSRRADVPNGFATAGIIVGIVATVLAIALILVLTFLVFIPLFQECARLGPGVHIVGGVTYTCNV